MTKETKNEIVDVFKSILIFFICLLSLCLLGSEPTTFDEEGLSNYERAFERGGSGWVLCWIWVWSVVTLVVLYIFKYFINKK
jgi:hypothetical protein